MHMGLGLLTSKKSVDPQNSADPAGAKEKEAYQ